MDQLIEKCRSSKVRCKLLEEGNGLTLPKEISLGRTVESVMAQQKEISGSRMTTEQTQEKGEAHAYRIQTKTVKKAQNESQPKKQTTQKRDRMCYRCGRVGHLASDSNCPDRNSTCKKCNLKGHFAAQCRTKMKGRRSENVNFAGEDEEEESEATSADDHNDEIDYEYVFAIDQENATTQVTIGGVKSEVIVDSGASSNIISERQWRRMQQETVKYKPQSTRKVLYPYGSSKPLQIVESFLAEVKVNSQIVNAEFIVVKGSGPILLVRETSIKLQLLFFGHVQDKGCYEDLPKRYKCFSGLGKLRDFKLKLHIDESILPVAQQARRIPFNLRDKVEREIENLLEADVIEPAQGPTPWISPVVVVPKPNGDVRLCRHETVVGHVLLRGCRIVIPHDLRERVLKLAHEGHQGIVKCKDRLRSKVWWPGIDKAIERVCRTCHGCQVTQAPSRPPPMKRTELPKGP